MYGTTCRVIKNISEYEKKSVETLLIKSGLRFEGAPQYTAVAEDSDENVIATASLDGAVIKMVAADEAWQEAGLSATVISALMQRAREDGIMHLFMFTKPEAAVKFSFLGFSALASSDKSVLMEFGSPNINDYRAKLNELKKENGAPAAAAVMNCNPSTLGHRWLIEQGAKENDLFYVIVVEEDASLFPFNDRIDLVRRGTADLKNVHVLSSSHYAISAATFPTYFLKEKTPGAIAAVQAELDAKLFAALYVPSLGIVRRYVGTEPLSPVTALYNDVLKKVLPPLGCSISEIVRKESGDTVISASRVRELLAHGEFNALESLVPPTTLEYLLSDRGREIAKKLRKQI